MKYFDVTLPTLRRKVGLRRTRWARKLIVAVTAFALVFSQTAPALAYGPGDAFAGYNDVRAMVNFRIPLGVSQADKDRAPSFGFTVKRQFQFNDPLYEALARSYQISTNLTVDVMDLRFGMSGKLSGFDVGGFNALQAKTRLNAAADGDGGTTRWIWVVGGIALIAALIAADYSCDNDSIDC